jgi:hypothetical protein
MSNKTATLDELRAMRKSGAIKPTRDDAPELQPPDDFWPFATPRNFKVKKQTSEGK